MTKTVLAALALIALVSTGALAANNASLGPPAANTKPVTPPKTANSTPPATKPMQPKAMGSAIKLINNVNPPTVVNASQQLRRGELEQSKAIDQRNRQELQQIQSQTKLLADQVQQTKLEAGQMQPALSKKLLQMRDRAPESIVGNMR
jgi:hypothetical protein